MATNIVLPQPVDPTNPTPAEIWAGIEATFNAVNEVDDQVNDVAVATHGSWTWDKTAGLLTMFDFEGNPTFIFNVSDTSENASRERRQDLEI